MWLAKVGCVAAAARCARGGWRRASGQSTRSLHSYRYALDEPQVDPNWAKFSNKKKTEHFNFCNIVNRNVTLNVQHLRLLF